MKHEKLKVTFQVYGNSPHTTLFAAIFKKLIQIPGVRVPIRSEIELYSTCIAQVCDKFGLIDPLRENLLECTKSEYYNF